MPKTGRPPLPPGKARVTLAVRVTQATKDGLEGLADTEQLSQGEVIDGLVAKRLGKPRPRPDPRR